MAILAEAERLGVRKRFAGELSAARLDLQAAVQLLFCAVSHREEVTP